MILQGDPYNLQGSTPSLQGGQAAAVLQPAASPMPVMPRGSAAPVATAAPAAPKPVVSKPAAPKPLAAPTPTGVVFYKPDPNSQQVYNASGQALSYDQYIAQGGRPDFSNVISDPQAWANANPAAFDSWATAKGWSTTPAQTFALGDGVYDVNGNKVQNPPPQGATTVPPTPPATPPALNPNQERIDKLSKQVFNVTAPDQQKLYEDAYNTAGLADIRTKLNTLNDQVAKIRDAYTAKEADINENPWLSEASRVGKVNRLNQQRDAEVGNLLEEYKQYADLYNQGVQEVNNSVARQVESFNSNRQISTEELNYLLGIDQTQYDRTTAAQKTAIDFQKDKNINEPFYKYPNSDTVYDTRTGEALNYDEYKARGGTGKPGAAFPDVQEISSDQGINLKDYPTSYQEYILAQQQGYTGSYTDYQNEDANRKARASGGGNTTVIGGLTTPQFNRLNTISDNARQDQNIKDFPAVRASYETARSAAAQGNSAGDIVLMRMIAKITDPTTGVREEEFKTFEGAQGILARYGVQLTKAMWGNGQLTATGRQRLLQQANDIYNQRKAAYDTSVQFFTKQADQVAPGQGSQVIPYYVAPDSSSGSSNVDLNDLF